MTHKKCNVLHIVTTLELGGAQKSALNLVKELDPAHYNKYFVSGPQGILHQEARHFPGAVIDIAPGLQRAVHPWKDVAALRWLVRYMRNRRIDIVHTHSSKAGIIGRCAARIAGVPVIVHTIHGWSFNSYQNCFFRGIYVMLERLAGRWTSKFIAVSQADIDKGLKNGIGTKTGYVLASYGLDAAVISASKIPAYRKEDMGIAAQRPVVGVVSCFKPQKNLKDMIAAARIVVQSVPEVLFVCAGDGEQRVFLERLIAENKVSENFMLLGWRKDIAAIFPLFDIVALSSLWEGMPIALLEAMFFEKPVAAYAVDGIPEIVIDNKNGFLVKPGDFAGLAAKITLLLRDKTMRERFGRAGKEAASALLDSKDRMVKVVEKTYNLLRKRNSD